MKQFLLILNKIKVGCKNKSHIIEVPNYKGYSELLKALYFEGFIQNYYIEKDLVFIYLRQYNGNSNIRQIKTYCRTNNFVYVTKKLLWLFNRHNGVLFLSTIKGLKTHEECLKRGLGGKALFLIV